MIDSRASIQVGEARTCTSIADEARIYLLVNGGGTAQTSQDMANARRIAQAGTGVSGALGPDDFTPDP